jgi:deaminated glutathione amidase
MSIFEKPSVRVAVLQTRIEQGEKECNWAGALDLFNRAMETGPALVVFPEAFSSGVNFIILRQMAECIPEGPTCEKLRQLAALHSVYIAAGVLELGADGKVYDALVLIDPQGIVAGKYRRRFLWTGERNYVSAGSESVVVKTEIGNIGLLVGYDLCFPEACAGFLQSDVDIAICAASVFERLNYNAPRLALARAIDHHCYFLYANTVGFHQFANMRYTGSSGIFVDPYFLQIQMGCVPAADLGTLSLGGDAPAFLQGNLHLEELALARRSKLPFKEDATYTLARGFRVNAAATGGK